MALTNYVIMPGADYQAACDKIREKTGKAGMIKSGDLATEIGSITGGGGTTSDERVKYVTFMNGDTELLKFPVISGDTCHNPVAKGYIDTPTKEQTVSTVYAYSGWSMNDGGEVSSSVLENVTADRTVYAVFTEAARTYMISFYDEDGTSLLKSEPWPYGETPIYTPTKDGFDFKEWTPQVVPVVGEASYTASWVPKQGFSQVAFVPSSMYPTGGSLSGFSVSNNGLILGTAMSSKAFNRVYAYNISSDEPVLMPSGTTSSVYWTDCDFTYDDAYFKLAGMNGASNYQASFAVSLSAMTGTSTSVSNTARMACSPVKDLYGWFNKSTTSWVQSDGTSFSISDTPSEGGVRYSPDGKHVAFKISSYVYVYNINTGARVNIIGQSVFSFSYNGDGSMVAIGRADGKIDVYETSGYTKLFTHSASGEVRVEFVGYDCLLYSGGSSAYVYTVTPEGLVPFEYSVPEQQGAYVFGFRRSHNGRYLAVRSNTGIAVWRKD